MGRPIEMDNAIEIYRNPAKYPKLQVTQYAIIDAIHTLTDVHRKVAALRLIRAAYVREDGTHASLDEAREIYTAITRKE